MLLNLITCSQYFKTLNELCLQNYDNFVKKKSENSFFKYYYAVIIQCNSENLKKKSFNDIIEVFKNVLAFERKEDFFYYDNLYDIESDDEDIKSNEPDGIFPKIIFENSKSKKSYNVKTMNNINLNDEIKQNENYFFYYSNFDAVKIVSNFLNRILDILIDSYLDDSTIVFVIDNIISKDRLDDLDKKFESELGSIVNFNFLSQIVLRNNTKQPKNDFVHFLKEIRTFRMNENFFYEDFYNFQNLFFLINKSDYKTVEIKKTIEKNFTNYTINDKFGLLFGNLDRKIEFKFEFALLTGKFLSHVSKETSNVEKKYLLLFFKYSYDDYYTFCFSDDECKNYNLINGQIICYNLYDCFTKFVQRLLENDKKFGLYVQNLKPIDFFRKILIGTFDSMKIQKIVLKNTKVTAYDIHDLLEKIKNVKKINIFNFECEKTALNHTLKELNFENAFQTIEKKYIIKNIRNSNVNENFLFELNLDDSEQICFYIYKKDYLKNLPFFLSNLIDNCIYEICIEIDEKHNENYTRINFFNYNINIFFEDENYSSTIIVLLLKNFSGLRDMSIISLIIQKIYEKEFSNTYNNIKNYEEFYITYENCFHKIEFDEYINNNLIQPEKRSLIRKRFIHHFVEILTGIYNFYHSNFQNNFFLEIHHIENENSRNKYSKIHEEFEKNYECEFSYLDDN
ncbi:hypothetical protein GVAV_001822 [Gurleya vavrai]